MLNRRIKSLLVAGLLVVGMSGSVFAAGNGNDGCYLGVDGHGSGNEHKIKDITLNSWTEFKNDFNNNANNKENGFSIVTKSENKNNGTYHILYGEEQIEVIHVDFAEPLTEEQKEAKRPKPEIPTLPEPETGDASIMPIAATAVAAAAGLYVVCKKDDEE